MRKNLPSELSAAFQICTFSCVWEHAEVSGCSGSGVLRKGQQWHKRSKCMDVTFSNGNRLESSVVTDLCANKIGPKQQSDHSKSEAQAGLWMLANKAAPRLQNKHAISNLSLFSQLPTRRLYNEREWYNGEKIRQGVRDNKAFMEDASLLCSPQLALA